VLVRGGERVPDDELLRRTHAVIGLGARGIVYGRNVIRHADPAAMIRALRAIVHEGATADEAARRLPAAAAARAR
jgi:DhnA family fructose-bisphosphate aldolase class Ia